MRFSPIHAAEVYYKRRYHLNFVHAKKLFVLDIILLATMFVLIGAAIFWFSYRPIAGDLVTLTIAIPRERVVSGEEVTYTIFYQNNNPFTLVAPQLKFNLPESFVVSRIEPNELYSTTGSVFNLPSLPPKADGVVGITGRLYQTPQQETVAVAHLSYQPAGRQVREETIARAETITRGSVIELMLGAPARILNHSATPVTLTLKNNGDAPVTNVTVPLPTLPGVAWGEGKVESGRIENNVWSLDQVASGVSQKLQVNLALNVAPSIKQLSLELIPAVTVNGQAIPQAATAHHFDILHPAIEIGAAWEGKQKLQPGEGRQLNLTIANRGTVELSDLAVSIPISPDVIDAPRLTQTTGWSYSPGALTTNQKHRPSLRALRGGETAKLTLTLPIRPALRGGGTDLTLTISARLNASVKEVPNSLYTATVSSPPLAIGTALNLSANLAYYTAEGDQLGRGPLPPQVGKETKYWATVEIRNTTSRVERLTLSARLAPGAAWTGRTSVSQGESPRWNPATRTVTWQIPTLNPHERVAVNFELALTPAPDERGTTPIMIENLTLTGLDTYINEEIRKERGSLDVSLPTDIFARKRGVVVE